MSYLRKTLTKILATTWETARDTIVKTFKEVDTETKKIKDETDRFHALSEIIHCTVTDDFDQVFDDDGDLVTTV